MSARSFFLDCQTTGPNPEKGALLELAWGFDESTIASYLVQVPDGIPNRIQQLTGVTDEDMRKALAPDDVLGRFIDSLQNHGIAATHSGDDMYAIIHYAKFEERFLRELFARFGRELPFKILCTHELAKRVMPQLPSRGLRALAGFFGHRKAEEKRAADHVEATIAVWRGLCDKMGCTDPREATRWLGEAVPKRSAFVYPLAKTKRLSLPNTPGVYRFLNRKGEILYVGKATSLKDRVNSYFRGRKGRDHRKLEMLTQAWDVDVTVCKNIMEASMLESDLIKEHTPPYNLALKSANKTLVYYSRDFLSVRMIQDRAHPMGPFPAFSALEQLWMFCQGVLGGEIQPEVFYDPVDPVTLQEGYFVFRETRGLSQEDCSKPRRLLAFGLIKLRELRGLDCGPSAPGDPGGEAELSVALTEAPESAVVADETDDERPPTPDEIAEKYERICIGAASDYLRSRAVDKLLYSEVSWSDERGESRLELFNGDTRPGDRAPASWNALGVKTYDRLSVLYSELQKAKVQGARVFIRPKLQRPERMRLIV